MSVNAEVQKLEPTALIELFQLDAINIGGDVLYFHANTAMGPIFWQGIEYSPWPFKAEGFSRTSERPPTPKLVVANLDGSISQLCLQMQDMVGARVTRVRTFAMFLDGKNFREQTIVQPPFTTTMANTTTVSLPLAAVEDAQDYLVRFAVTGLSSPIGIRLAGAAHAQPIEHDGAHAVLVTAGAGANTLEFYSLDGVTNQDLVFDQVYVEKVIGNPDADASQQMPPEVWFIDRKAAESNDAVEFELASAFDLNGVKLPRRQVISNYCSFRSIGGYRGPYCGYTGPAVAKRDGTPTTDMAEDDCGGKLSDCKLRQWPDDQLGFGGFPAAGLMRT